MPTDLTVRLAGPSDAGAITTLARLDSAAPLTGDALIAESGGRPVAAIGLGDGRVVADPFARSAPAVEVLQVRAGQIRPASGGRERRGVAHRMRPHWVGS